jgi:hypothetical protein
MPSRPYSRRTPYDHVRPALAKYSALIGEVTWASNNLHASLYLLFQGYFPDARNTRGMAQEMWHAFRSDDMQRAALRAIFLHSAEISERQRKSYLWIIDAAGRLSEYRNDAIHTAMDLYPNKRRLVFKPSDAGHPKRVEKLTRVGHEKLFKFLIGDLNQLDDYALSLFEQTLRKKWAHRPDALPKRPVLRSVLLVQKSPPKNQSPTRHPPKRKRQRAPLRVK